MISTKKLDIPQPVSVCINQLFLATVGIWHKNWSLLSKTRIHHRKAFSMSSKSQSCGVAFRDNSGILHKRERLSGLRWKSCVPRCWYQKSNCFESWRGGKTFSGYLKSSVICTAKTTVGQVWIRSFCLKSSWFIICKGFVLSGKPWRTSIWTSHIAGFRLPNQRTDSVFHDGEP